LNRPIRLLSAARRDIGRLVAFLRDKSPAAANKAAAKLSRAILSLDRFVDRGRRGPDTGLRELVVRFGRDAYIVQYRVDDSEVIIARVFHSKEDRR